MIIAQASLSDNGVYMCMATNEAGAVSRTIEISNIVGKSFLQFDIVNYSLCVLSHACRDNPINNPIGR